MNTYTTCLPAWSVGPDCYKEVYNVVRRYGKTAADHKCQPISVIPVPTRFHHFFSQKKCSCATGYATTFYHKKKFISTSVLPE